MRTFRPITLTLAVLAATALTYTFSGVACADIIVAPNANATVEGNTSTGQILATNLNQRYQEVFAASAFSAITSPKLITQVSFRQEAGSAANSFTLSHVQVDLSTTFAAPDALSSTFANNVGADHTTVFDGALTINSAAVSAGGLGLFDIVITFTQPFLYNPGAGNLLLDIRNFGGGGSGADPSIDTVNVLGDAVDRVRGGVNDPTGSVGGGSSFGLVAQFTLTNPSLATVPEPVNMALVGFASALLGWSWFRSRRNTEAFASAAV